MIIKNNDDNNNNDNNNNNNNDNDNKQNYNDISNTDRDFVIMFQIIKNLFTSYDQHEIIHQQDYSLVHHRRGLIKLS